MTRSMEKSFRRIKRSYTLLSFISLIFFFLLTFILINGAFLFFILYSISSKIDNQYELIKHTSAFYDATFMEADTDILDELMLDYPDYFVLDEDGNVVTKHGEDTCSYKGGPLFTLFGNRDYLVYEDTEDKNLFYSGMGMFLPNLASIQHKAIRVLSGVEPDLVDVDSLEEDEDAKILDMPVWIEMRLSDGHRLLQKAYVQVHVTDLIVLVSIAGALNVLVVLLMIVRIVRVIRGFIMKKRLTKLFLVDEVTGGNNWMAFLLKGNRLLKKRKSAGKRYAMVHFVIVKYRNYCMCHSLEEGRILLYRMAEQIRQNLSPRTELSAHVSSSSFALLLEAPNDEFAKGRIQNLLWKLKNVDISSGSAKLSEDTETSHTFNFQAGVQIIEPNIVDGKLKKRKDAEIEKYYNNAVTAKSTLEVTEDDGIAFFDKKLMEDEQWINTVEENQKKALDNEEFVVYYQPKYSPDKGELIGAEALIRWQSPEYGFIPPGRFIPVFEKNGFITNIDHYMLRHVAEDQKKWLDLGLKCVPVSVNVSRAHFAEADLADQILNMVDAAGTPHNLIEIELTESAFFDDKNAIIGTIDRLKAYGFSVSMDDFGSGYSSLNSLKDMNLDVLKLDADFFRGNADPERKEAVVSEAIRLAKRLKMRTVAEGVEDKDQVEFLKDQGCDMIQGYYFAKPMPKDEYVERMKEIYHMPGSEETKGETH